MEPIHENRFIYRLPLVNFLLAALLGTVLRFHVYRPIPHFNFLNWLQVHSHLMFLGWVTLALFIFIFRKLDVARYNSLIISTIIVFELASLAMLISFPTGGYGVLSVVMLSITMVAGFIFLWIIMKTTGHLQNAGWRFIGSGLIFMVVSSAGPLALGPISAMGLKDTLWYNYAIYFYLHFQYNGWFFMAITGLIILGSGAWEVKNRPGIMGSARYLNLAIVLTFFLSVLGYGNTLWFNVMGGAGAILQLVIITRFIKSYLEFYNRPVDTDPGPAGIFLRIAILSLYLKLVLQVFSAFPFMTEFIEGTRAVIISYLHLVLIGFVSLSLLNFYLIEPAKRKNISVVRTHSYIFLAGFFLNEFVLLITVTGGIAIIIPQLLVTASVIMVIGIAGFLAAL